MRARTNEEKLRKRETCKRLINLGLVLICLGLEIAVFHYHWLFYFRQQLVEGLKNLWFRATLAELILYAMVLLFLSATYGSMRLGYQKNSEIIFSQVLSTLGANVILYVQLSIMARQLLVLDVFIRMMVEQTILVLVYINLASRIYRRVFPPRKLLLIHGERSPEDICNKFATRKDKYIVTRKINVKEGHEALCRMILQCYESGECNAVVLGDISVEERGPLLKFCYGRSIRVYILPKITDVILSASEELHIFDSPLLLTREYSLTIEQRIAKRTIDLVCSLILLVLTSPFMLLTAVAVKVYDGGPILYKQVRCTRDRREFRILKFRSMRMDAEKDGVARLAQRNDSRITPVGKVIRKCRMDELPQLINILKGDMSFIGPRPERPEIIEQYMEVMPEFAFRMKVKAGLAGFAQVYGKYNTSPYDKLKLDLAYIENYTVWLDIKLMMLTVKVLFLPDSTEGVETEQVTALKADVERSREAEGREEGRK